MAFRRVLALLVPAMVCVSTLGQVAVPAPGNTDVNANAILDGVIRDLASDDVLLRLDAQRRLVDASEIKLRDIESAMKRSALGPEQWKRLMTAAYSRFCVEPRAVMGVQADPMASDRGVVLQSVMPGFPAADVLRSGDRLLTVDGRSVTDINQMRPIVFSHDPGDEIPVVVIRAGATLNLKVRLGNIADRNQRGQFQVTSDVIEESWGLRTASLSSLMPKRLAPIDCGLTPEMWRVERDEDFGPGYNDGGDPNTDPTVRSDTRRLQDPEQVRPEVVAAGEPRGDGLQVRWGSGMVPPTVRVVPRDGMNVIVGPRDGRADVVVDRERKRAAWLAEIVRQQTGLKTQISLLQGELSKATAPRRAEINAEIAALQRRVEQLDKQLRDVMLVEP